MTRAALLKQARSKMLRDIKAIVSRVGYPKADLCDRRHLAGGRRFTSACAFNRGQRKRPVGRRLVLMLLGGGYFGHCVTKPDESGVSPPRVAPGWHRSPNSSASTAGSKAISPFAAALSDECAPCDLKYA